MSGVSVRNLSFSYTRQSGAEPTLDGVSFELPQGQLIGVVGPNGSGKSTLAKVLARQERIFQGEILLDSQPLASYSTRELARRVAYLPQRPLTPPGISVEQLVQYGRHPHQGWLRQWSAQDRLKVDEACRLMAVETLLDASLGELSGGQAQRAWLAMILAQDTPLILLDEPTSALDIGHQAEVMEAVHAMTLRGKTVVIVMHDLAAAARYCHQLIALQSGRLAAFGPAREVISKSLVDRLYDTDVDVLAAPEDGAPVIVPRRRRAS